jgi:hypothetical protein
MRVIGDDALRANPGSMDALPNGSRMLKGG